MENRHTDIINDYVYKPLHGNCTLLIIPVNEFIKSQTNKWSFTYTHLYIR